MLDRASQAKTAFIIPNAIEITTAHEKRMLCGLCGTEIAYGAVVCGTEIAYGAGVCGTETAYAALQYLFASFLFRREAYQGILLPPSLPLSLSPLSLSLQSSPLPPFLLSRPSLLSLLLSLPCPPSLRFCMSAAEQCA
eukprot:3098970-Rhodomonas_salina.1